MEDEVLKINRKLQSFLWQLLSKIEKRIGQTQSALTEVGKHIRTIHSGPKCLWSPGRLIELPPLFDSQGNIPNIPPSIQERQSLVEEKLPLRHEPSKWSTGDDDKLRKIVKEVCVVSRVQKLSQIWLDSGGAEEVRLEIMGAGDKEIAMDEVDALNWGEIANMMQGRLSRECEFRWKNFAGTHINRSEEWSDEESVLLIKLAKKYSGRNWDFISKELNTGRTAFQCFERFQVYHNANIKSSFFSKEEDALIQELVRQYGRQWKLISEELCGHSPSQIFHHYNNTLTSEKTGKWNNEEDIKVILARSSYETNWTYISQILGRSQLQCRDRYEKVLSKQFKRLKKEWSSEETELLMRKVKEIGPGKWTQISAFLPQKTAVQCSNRWLSVSSVDEICAHKRAVWTKRSIQSGASTDQYKKQKLDIDAITIELLGGRKVK